MKNKVILIICLALFTFYSLLLIAQKEGYYKSRNEKAKILTQEQIEEFEKDVSLGRSVDIRKYVLYEDKDYSNNLSDDIYSVSLKLESVFDTTIKFIFNGVSKTVNDQNKIFLLIILKMLIVYDIIYLVVL